MNKTAFAHDAKLDLVRYYCERMRAVFG